MKRGYILPLVLSGLLASLAANATVTRRVTPQQHDWP